jgi:hypothetical protein
LTSTVSYQTFAARLAPLRRFPDFGARIVAPTSAGALAFALFATATSSRIGDDFAVLA